MVFEKTPDFDVLWALQLRNTHRHKPHSKQTNQDIHKKDFVSKQPTSSKPHPWFCAELLCCW